MELRYLKMVFRIKRRLWEWWHMKLPYRIYGLGHLKKCRMCGSKIKSLNMAGLKDTDQRWMIDPRPWWHLCCNGDSGGWRTDVCDWLEGYPNGWRGLEDRAYLYQEEREDEKRG